MPTTGRSELAAYRPFPLKTLKPKHHESVHWAPRTRRLLLANDSHTPADYIIYGKHIGTVDPYSSTEDHDQVGSSLCLLSGRKIRRCSEHLWFCVARDIWTGSLTQSSTAQRATADGFIPQFIFFV